MQAVLIKAYEKADAAPRFSRRFSMERLDKWLASTGYWSRKEARELIKKGRAAVNGVITRAADVKCEAADITVDGKPISVSEHTYIMLNKPAGVLSATEDKRQQTVLDLLPSHLKRQELFPVGRLDKDTEGLLLLTNDGDLAHRLLTPKNHVPKVYHALIEGCIDEDDIRAFAEGIILADGTSCTKAELSCLVSPEGISAAESVPIPDSLDGSADSADSRSDLLQGIIFPSDTEHPVSVMSLVKLVIDEGKFHQVKRMLGSRGKPVLYLKRVSMGALTLDKTLDKGAFRELTKAEILLLNR